METQFVVADARQRDVGRGTARIDIPKIKDLDLEPGDVIGLMGKRKTLAIAWPCYQEDKGKKIIRIDGFIRKNAGVAINENVKMSIPKIETAKAILLAPTDMRLSVDEDFTNFVKNRLKERAFAQGDTILVIMLGHAIPFNVVRVAPSPEKCVGVVVGDTTKVNILNEPFEPLESDFSDVKYLFRNDWLRLVLQRLRASRVTYAIKGTETELESETEIIKKAKESVENQFTPVDISVKFYSSSRDLLGSLPWISVNLSGSPTAIYPESKLPTYLFNPQLSQTRENTISNIGRC